MRRFLIKVNGVAYDVEVEDAVQPSPYVMPAAPAAAAAAPAPAPAAATAPTPPAASAAPAPAPAAPSAPSAPGTVPGKTGREAIKAPMPGTILGIQSAVGQAVKKNQVLLVLEAMKMENEIVSPRDGIIAGIHTSKGSSVNAGDLLVSLE